jgi:hypothetical protein
MLGKDYADLSLGEQARVMRAVERDPAAPKKPPASPQAIERAFAAQAERSKRLTGMVSEESRKKLTSLGKTLPGYETTVSMGGVDVPLSAARLKEYERLVADEYNKAVSGWPEEKLRQMRPDARDDYMRRSLTEAKSRAKSRLIGLGVR